MWTNLYEEPVRSGYMAVISLVLFASNYTLPQDAPVGSEQKFISAEQSGSTLFRRDSAGNRAAPEAKKCAYILILGIPEIDPKMVKEVPEEVKNTMPILQGLPPCSKPPLTTHEGKSGALK